MSHRTNHRYGRAARTVFAVVGVLFCVGAVLPLREGNMLAFLTLGGLGIACLVAARSGQDPLNADGSRRSFQVRSMRDEIDRMRRDDEA